jgi:hypothetical protein
MMIESVAARWLLTAVFTANQEGQSAGRGPLARGYRSRTRRPPDTLDERRHGSDAVTPDPEREKGDAR